MERAKAAMFHMSLWSEHPVPKFSPKENELACSRRLFNCRLAVYPAQTLGEHLESETESN